jgi:hypothetical protein
MKLPHYSFHILWSKQDKSYIGTCTEFPSLSWIASSHSLAFTGIYNLILNTIKDLKLNKEPIPKPKLSQNIPNSISLNTLKMMDNNIPNLKKSLKDHNHVK